MLNLRFYDKESLIDPYRRNIFQQAIPVAILEIDRDQLQKVVRNYEERSAAERSMLSFDMEKFRKLEFGMKYEEVVSVLGEEGANNQSMVNVSSSGGSTEMKSYVWQSANFGTISCSFVDEKLSHKRFLNTSRRKYKKADLSGLKYDQLKIRMSYQEVRNIIGSDGLLLTSSAAPAGVTERFSWRSEKGTISVLFRNGALFNKRRNGFK
ncbi:MAG: hypothetical protein HKN25_00610 [Pyrinomonadaceae bacterium]|nr:hypothetical protein [Pyrinomonadaceae bacterium]